MVFFFLMIRRPPRSTLDRSSAASDVYKRQASGTAWAAVGTPGAKAAQAAAHAARPRVSRDRVGPIVAADAQEVAMDAAKYFIRGVTLLATDPGLQEALSRVYESCLLYTSPSPRDRTRSRMPSSA